MFVVTTRYGPHSCAPICGDISVSLRCVFEGFSIRFRAGSQAVRLGDARQRLRSLRSTTIYAQKPKAVGAMQRYLQVIKSLALDKMPIRRATGRCRIAFAAALRFSAAHKPVDLSFPRSILDLVEWPDQLPQTGYTTVLSCVIQYHDKTP